MDGSKSSRSWARTLQTGGSAGRLREDGALTNNNDVTATNKINKGGGENKNNSN